MRACRQAYAAKIMQKITIATIIIILCLVAGIIFFGWDEYKEFNNLKFQLESSKADLKSKQEYFSKLNEVLAKLNENDVELAKIDSALPATSVVPEMVNFLAEKSSQNGLILEKVDSEKISPLTKGSKIQKVSLDLTLSGFYPALRNFISSLQNSAKIIEINSIKFSEPKQGDVFSFNLIIETYSY